MQLSLYPWALRALGHRTYEYHPTRRQVITYTYSVIVNSLHTSDPVIIME